MNRKMFALCNRYISDPYEAEDVMMAGFMVVFSKIEQFKGDGSFEGWVKRIMVTHSLQFIRKSKSMEINRSEGDSDFQDQVHPDFNSNLDYQVLLEMVQKLPMGYRMVFNLFAIEGYGHNEIAEMLNISEGASKSQLFKARGMLQNWVLQLDMGNSKNNRKV
jgi:RNA polymerase sigma-70 factor (ECF subfamily)